MAYGEQIFYKADEIIKKRKYYAEAALDSRRMRLIKDCPELLTLESELAATGQAVARVFELGGPEEAVEYILGLKKKNLEIQSDIAKLLSVSGLPADYLEPNYECGICGDSGVNDGNLCSCFTALMRSLAYEELCGASPLKISGFDKFFYLRSGVVYFSFDDTTVISFSNYRVARVNGVVDAVPRQFFGAYTSLRPYRNRIIMSHDSKVGAVQI